jgi:hypothetical protein
MPMAFRVTGDESLFGLFGRHEVARESDSMSQKCERLVLVLSMSNASRHCKRRRYRIVRAGDSRTRFVRNYISTATDGH